MVPESYILVGGRSSRFAGGNKPSALFSGKTLAENAVEITRAALRGSDIFLVARDADHFAEEARRSGVGCIHDRIEGRGPIGALFTALAGCGSEWLFLFACDMPLMSPSVIARMSELCRPRFGAFVPRQADGRLQPLCAFYNVAEAIPVVEALIHRPGGSAAMADVIRALEARIIEPGEIGAAARVWTNVNTLEDLEAAGEIERKLSARREI